MITVQNKPTGRTSVVDHSQSQGGRTATDEAEELMRKIVQVTNKTPQTANTPAITSAIIQGVGANDDNDDFIDEDIYSEYRPVTNIAHVHIFINDLYHKIDDIFDDDDIT